MSISYGDKAVDTLRNLVSVIESELTSTAPGSALRVAWGQVVEILALGPAPELRECPSCGGSGMRTATRCMYCWSALPLLSSK